MFVMIDSVREKTVKKSCKHGEYGSFGHLLFLLSNRPQSTHTRRQPKLVCRNSTVLEIALTSLGISILQLFHFTGMTCHLSTIAMQNKNKLNFFRASISVAYLTFSS